MRDYKTQLRKRINRLFLGIFCRCLKGTAKFADLSAYPAAAGKDRLSGTAQEAVKNAICLPRQTVEPSQLFTVQ